MLRGTEGDPVNLFRSPRSPWLGLLRTVLLQTMWAVPFALFFGTMFGGTRQSYVLAYQASLVFAWTIGVSLWAVRYFVEPRIVAARGRARGLGLRIVFTYCSVALVASYVAAWVIHLTLMPGFLASPRSVIVSTMFTLLFVGLFGGISAAIAFYRVMTDQARAIERQSAELARAELRALRAQVDPHFLFNTLNTIASLIREDPAEAEETTTRLADLFRYALSASDHEHRRLADELAFLRDYVAIERTRFGERLRVVERIEPGLDDLPVPSLLLQPLVENAVRHGLAPRPQGGTLTLGARRAGDTVVLEVADDGDGCEPARALDAATADARFGLRSVRERLRLAGPPHAFTLESRPGGGTRAIVVVPAAPVVTRPSTPSASTPTPGGSSSCVS
jgi:signal transduction histidine kinase